METLTSIPKRGVWSESTSKIDQNFRIFETELNKIDEDAKKCKGLFPSLESLNATFPEPAAGSWAYVGSALPAPIYIYNSSGGWTSTGKTGGNFNPSNYANSVAINSAEDLYASRGNWISGYNGWNWTDVVNGNIYLNNTAEFYEINLKSLSYGEKGEFLEESLTSPYIFIFDSNKGSFESLDLYSSDGIHKEYTTSHSASEDTLSWRIDKNNNTFYKRVVGGREENRLPTNGDTLRATLRFRCQGDNEIKIIGFVFKFIL